MDKNIYWKRKSREERLVGAMCTRVRCPKVTQGGLCAPPTFLAAVDCVRRITVSRISSGKDRADHSRLPVKDRVSQRDHRSDGVAGVEAHDADALGSARD